MKVAKTHFDPFPSGPTSLTALRFFRLVFGEDLKAMRFPQKFRNTETTWDLCATQKSSRRVAELKGSKATCNQLGSSLGPIPTRSFSNQGSIIHRWLEWTPVTPPKKNDSSKQLEMTSHYLASQQAYQHKVITTLEFTKKAQRAQKHSKDVIASVKITSKSKVWNLDDFCTLTADPAAMSDSPRYNDGNHVKLKPSCAVVSTKKRLPS